MRSTILLITILFLFGITTTVAQNSCLPDGIFFHSQSAIDSFPVNYPDCTIIEGDVRINDSVALTIHSLDSLYPLTAVSGNFYINDNGALTNFEGLHNLREVGKILVFL